jgi:hypothetical protein
MFLQRLTDYPLSDLLHSYYGVAVCQLEPEPLKNTIVELLNRGHLHLVLEATDGSFVASRRSQHVQRRQRGRGCPEMDTRAWAAVLHQTIQ